MVRLANEHTHTPILVFVHVFPPKKATILFGDSYNEINAWIIAMCVCANAFQNPEDYDTVCKHSLSLSSNNRKKKKYFYHLSYAIHIFLMSIPPSQWNILYATITIISKILYRLWGSKCIFHDLNCYFPFFYHMDGSCIRMKFICCVAKYFSHLRRVGEREGVAEW